MFNINNKSCYIILKLYINLIRLKNVKLIRFNILNKF